MIARKFAKLIALSTVWIALLAEPVPGSGAESVDYSRAEAAAAVSATALSTQQIRWHRLKIRALWLETHPGETDLPAAGLDAILAGDYDRLNDGSVNHLALVLSGLPYLQPTPAGMLLAGGAGGFWPHCSVVLTSPNTAVTAAHCVRNLPTGTSLKVYFPYEGVRDPTTDGITLACENQTNPCTDDLAIISLAAPYSFTPVAEQGSADLVGPGSSVGTLGFGASNQILFDNGVLHGGEVTIRKCTCGGHSNERVLCYRTRYGSQTPGPPQYVNFSGDSGGPMFARDASSFKLLGIANGIETACREKHVLEGRYADTREGIALPWLSQAFCSPDCPQRPQGKFDVLLSLALAYVDGENLRQHRITVAQGTDRLTLTLNHEVNGFHPEPGGDLDIELPDSLESDCKRYYGVKSCEVLNPPPGEYSIGIKAVTGNPAYQLTALAELGEE